MPADERQDYSAKELTSGSRLARNSLINAASQVVPIALTLLVMPLLLHGLGDVRFGILTFLWTVLSYFAVSDLGIGYVTTQLVAMRLGTADKSGIPEVFWTCMVLLLVIGIALMLGFFLLVPLVGQLRLIRTRHVQGGDDTLPVHDRCLPAPLYRCGRLQRNAGGTSEVRIAQRGSYRQRGLCVVGTACGDRVL